jgi:citrate lyase subunit beta/citryl-CoA lyase
MAVARSYLFVPGNRPERFGKACAAGADAVIIDLEDAVAPQDKAAARAAVAAWLSARQPVLIRVNAVDTPWFDDDIALCAHPGVAGVVLPKAECAEQLAVLRAAGAAALYPLVETARGIAQANALAAAPAVQRLLFGAIDFQLDMGIEDDGEALLPFRSQLVLASRLAGVAPPVDGVTVALDDAGQLRRETLRARRLGFGGKLCIHPRQVVPVNACFAPTAEEIAWAQRILDAAAGAHGAAVAVDGKMVDRPVLLRAQRIIEETARRAPDRNAASPGDNGAA